MNSLFVWVFLIVGIYLIVCLFKWGLNSGINNKLKTKYKKRSLISFIIAIVSFIIIGVTSPTSKGKPTHNSSKAITSKDTNKLYKKETYLSVSPSDDIGNGKATFNRQGKATFDIYVHKGSIVYFNDNDNTNKVSKTNDGKYANLKRINPTHYQVTMNYQQSADDTSGDGNTTNISAKAKGHHSQSVELDGNDNSAEKSTMKQKSERRDQQKAAKLAKEYPPIQDKLQSMNNNQLFMTQAMVKGKVLSWGAQNDGSGMILIKDSAGNEFTLEPSHRLKGIEDGSTVVAYGGNFDKQKINSSQTNNAISSEYLGDKVINMPSIDHIKLLGNKGDV